MIMKENHSAAFCDSESYGKETNPQVFGVKEIYQLDDSGKGVDPVRFEGDDGELSCVSGLERDEDYGEKMRSSLSVSDVGEFILGKESDEPGDSGTLPTTKFNLPETDKNHCIDKNVLECQLPELVVCDKKINDQSVKDICIDEGMPAKDRNLNGSVSQIPSDDFHCCGEEGVDNEFITSNRLAMTSLENTDRFDENDCGNAEVNDKEVLTQSTPKSPPDSSFDRDSSENCGAENSAQTDEAVCGTSGMIDGDKESFANSELPAQELSTRRSLRSLFISFDDKEGKFVQPLVQISAGNEVSESPESLPAAVEPTTNNQSNHIWSDSNSDKSGGTSNINELSDQESVKPNELSAGSELETSASTKNDSVEPSVMKHDLKNSNDASAVSSQLLYAEEESSFPVAGLITYSGPIAYSGSLSHRSDGSATSGKSFAFPILSSEWNTSPVRMAKADRRHYQKRKSWKSGIFCCRF